MSSKTVGSINSVTFVKFISLFSFFKFFLRLYQSSKCQNVVECDTCLLVVLMNDFIFSRRISNPIPTPVHLVVNKNISFF